jgi:hypothetical protein
VKIVRIIPALPLLITMRRENLKSTYSVGFGFSYGNILGDNRRSTRLNGNGLGVSPYMRSMDSIERGNGVGSGKLWLRRP